MILKIILLIAIIAVFIKTSYHFSVWLEDKSYKNILSRIIAVIAALSLMASMYLLFTSEIPPNAYYRLSGISLALLVHLTISTIVDQKAEFKRSNRRMRTKINLLKRRILKRLSSRRGMKE